MDKLDLKYLPSLPGFKLSEHKENHHKKQTWGYNGDTRVEFIEGVTHDKPKFVIVPKTKNGWKQGSTLPESTYRETFTKEEQDFDLVPSWDANEHQVLRFFGYWQEHIDERNEENQLNHRVIIYYYLEDDTMQVVEPREENSGRWQGTIIRRHRIPHDTNQYNYVHPTNIRVGSNITLYNKTIHISDCDQYTRDWFVAQGYEEQKPSEPIRDDLFITKRMNQEVKSTVMPLSYDKRYREVLLGGCQINEDMQNFMELDGKVCRFYCILDDYTEARFERRYFVLLYFLADNSIELREQFVPNSGRCEFPIFLRRKKLPRHQVKIKTAPSTCKKNIFDKNKPNNKELISYINGPMDSALTKNDYIKINEIAVGYTIELQEQEFLVYDADKYTRDYFKNELNVYLSDKIDVHLHKLETIKHSIPPSTGFGGEEDSLASVHNLIPKVPKKDFIKLSDNVNKVLRFTAEFARPQIQDRNRQFIVSFFCSDDTILVHEPPVRNSGMSGGRFLVRDKVKTSDGCRYLNENDMKIGMLLETQNGVLKITGCDERTYNIQNNIASEVPSVNPKSIIERFRERVRNEKAKIAETFLMLDDKSEGRLSLANIQKALKKYNLPNDIETATIVMKHFDLNEDGAISYNEFADVVLDRDVMLNEAERHANIRVRSEFDKEYLKLNNIRNNQVQMSLKIKNTTREIQHAMYIRTQSSTRLLKELVRMTSSQCVSCEQIRQGLANLGLHFTLEQVQECVSYVCPGVDFNNVNYTNFVQALSISYHDLPHRR